MDHMFNNSELNSYKKNENNRWTKTESKGIACGAQSGKLARYHFFKRSKKNKIN